MFVLNTISGCVYFTGEGCFEVKIEADSNDTTRHPHDDKPRPHLCMVCDKRLTTKVGLDRHKLLHSEERFFECHDCEKYFPDYARLRSHMNIHTSKYKCSECGKCFSSKHTLTLHGRSHSGEKPFVCTVCGKQFRSSTSLAVHSRIHSGKKEHECHLCGKAFSESGSLTTHLRIHAGDRPHKCTLCEKSFIQTGHLQRHILHVHISRRPYDCQYCEKRFKSDLELKRHVRTHTGAKLYPCTHCSDRFTRPDQLKSHLLKSHNEGSWLICGICQMKFSRLDTLKRHVLHHEVVKRRELSKEHPNWKSHQLMDTEVKQFCCGLFGKDFIRKHYVNTNFKRDTGHFVTRHFGIKTFWDTSAPISRHFDTKNVVRDTSTRVPSSRKSRDTSTQDNSDETQLYRWFFLDFGTNFVVPKCLVAEVSGSPLRDVLIAGKF